MKLKMPAIAFIIVVIIFGSITVTSSLGLWRTKSSKVPARYSSGEYAGEYNPADIRGSYTFGEISELFGIPLEDLGKAFAIKDEARYAAFQCKELEVLYEASKAEGKEIGTNSVRVFVALYKSLPIALDSGTYLPKPALDILKSNSGLTTEQLEYLETHTITPVEGKTTPDTDADVHSENKVNGQVTFRDLMGWGVSKSELENIVGGEIADESKAVRDYCLEKGIEFSAVKDQLQNLVDMK